jgi:hypothetical protein
MQAAPIRIAGIPATFATSREQAWKADVARDAPAAPMGGRETGLVMRFLLPTLAPNSQPLDVDNLCEPVIAVLARERGWFGGARTRIAWWSASKEVGAPPGCEVVVHEDAAPRPDTAATYDHVYRGIMPRNAKAPEVATWAAAVVEAEPHPVPQSCTLRLGFGSPTVNLGDISTGVVKSFVDCLYPFYGGRPGAPEDWRISRLTVERAVPGLAGDEVRVRFWFEGADVRATEARGLAVEVRPVPPRAAPAAEERGTAVSNPCRPGTAKWVVVEGALRGATVEEVRAELEKLKPGWGSRLLEYKSDVRSENGLDIRIEDDRLVC